jgi:hypothetical protein
VGDLLARMTRLWVAEVVENAVVALASVFEIIISEAGRRTRENQSQKRIADELRPAIEAIIDELDRWLTPAMK